LALTPSVHFWARGWPDKAFRLPFSQSGRRGWEKGSLLFPKGGKSLFCSKGFRTYGYTVALIREVEGIFRMYFTRVEFTISVGFNYSYVFC
jgi:hypothetical protein